jgi:hypothetical protein
MKIKPEHLEHMRHAIGNASKAPCWNTYKAAGLSPKRWRWDVAYSAGLNSFLCAEIYTYANDEHFDTALRHILGEGE